MLRREECSGVFKENGLFPLLLLEEEQGEFFFLVVHCLDQIELLEVKLTKVWKFPYTLEFLTGRLVHTGASKNVSIYI